MLAVCWLSLSLLHFQANPYPALAGDAIAYYTVASDIATQGDMSSRFYYFKSLIQGDFPLKEPHFPGYHLTLAGFFKLFTASEGLGKIFNYVTFTASLLLFYRLSLRLTCSDITTSVLATLLLMTYPIINMSFIMAEVIVIFSNMVCVYIIFIIFRNKPNLTSSFLLAGSLIYAILVRPNAIFMVPGIVLIFHYRKNWYWLGMTILFGLFLTLSVVASGLLADRMTFPASFLSELIATSDIETGVKLIGNNLRLNIAYFWTGAMTDWHGLSLTLFMSMFVLACCGFFLTNSSQRWFVRFVLLYFLINLAAICLLYEVPGWRFLRSSVQFVPLLILAVVFTLREYFAAKRSNAVFVCFILLFGAVSPSFHTQFINWQKLEQKKAWAYKTHFAAVLPVHSQPYYLISNLPYPRFVIDYSNSYAAVVQSFEDLEKSLSKVLDTYPATDIVLSGTVPQSTEILLVSLGFKPIHNRGELNFYRRIPV